MKNLLIVILSVGSLFASTAAAQGWRQIVSGLPQWNGISAVDTSVCWFAGSRTFVIRIVNGTTIQWKDLGLEPGIMTAIHARSADLAWVATGDGKIYRTTDGGTSWQKQFQHVAGPAAFFNGIYFWDDNIGVAFGDPLNYPSAGPFLIMRTTNGGTNWDELTAGVPSISGQYGVTMRFDAAENNLWFATALQTPDTLTSRVMYRTRDKGLTWDTLSIPQHFGDFNVSFADTLNGLITGFFGKIARTTDGGATWELRRDSPGAGPLKLQKDGSVGYLQGYFNSELGYSPLYRTTDFGVTWTEQQKPTPVGIIGLQVVNENYAWAGGFGYTILRTTTGGVPTSVPPGANDNARPASFELLQNYPNPFNPVTTIKYRLFQSGHTRVVIYDNLGRSIRTIVDEHQTEGWHLVGWDGRDNAWNPVSSGVYFYRVESGAQNQTRKMILLK